MNTPKVIIRVLIENDLDAEDLVPLTRRLRAALLELDVKDVKLATEEEPDGTKGAGTVLGWMWVTVGGETIKRIVNRVADWCASTGRSVEITVGDKSLKVNRISRDQQQELINTFVDQLQAP